MYQQNKKQSFFNFKNQNTMPFLKGTPPYMLSNTISEKQKKDSQFYALKCKIQECKQQISFFTEMLNNPKASVETQRKCLFYIEEEEIIMSKLESQIKQFEQI